MHTKEYANGEILVVYTQENSFTFDLDENKNLVYGNYDKILPEYVAVWVNDHTTYDIVEIYE